MVYIVRKYAIRLAKKLRIGTRGSKLALWQAHHVQSHLQQHGLDTEIQVIKTQGDRVQHLSFDKLEGKGFFTKEIEEHLRTDQIDLAVHSLKDLPTEKDEHLRIGALTQRASPSDILIANRNAMVEGETLGIKQGAIVGTSSLRRQAQIAWMRPDVACQDLRGNVPTRIEKLRRGDYDAIILAHAGVSRLEIDLADFHTWVFSPREFVPAAGQGVVALQIRREDDLTAQAVAHIHQPAVARCSNVERKVLQLMDGGCHVPLGVYCESDQLENYHVWAAWQPPESKLKQIKVSLGTTHELAEQVVHLLKN